MAVTSTQKARFISNEILSGIVDGVNKEFTLANIPLDGIILRLSGSVQVPGEAFDYTISGTVITFTKAPKVGMEVLAAYFTLY